MLFEERITDRIIGAAIEIHRALGPGLLESAYEECLAYELKTTGIEFRRQVPLPVVYREVRLEQGYKIDFIRRKGDSGTESHRNNSPGSSGTTAYESSPHRPESWSYA